MFKRLSVVVTNDEEGNLTIGGVPFEPKGITVKAGAKVGSTEIVTRHSYGSADVDSQGCFSSIGGSGQHACDDFTDRVVNCYTTPGGTLTNACVASFVEFVQLSTNPVEWGVKLNFSEVRTGTAWRIDIDVHG